MSKSPTTFTAPVAKPSATPVAKPAVSTQNVPKPTAPDMSKVQAVVAKPTTTPMVSKVPETAKKVPT